MLQSVNAGRGGVKGLVARCCFQHAAANEPRKQPLGMFEGLGGGTAFYARFADSDIERGIAGYYQHPIAPLRSSSRNAGRNMDNECAFGLKTPLHITVPLDDSRSKPDDLAGRVF